MGIYVFSRDVASRSAERRCRHRLRPRDHPVGARQATGSKAHLFRGYWADVGTVDSFYDANLMLTRSGSPFKFYDPRRPIYTHPRFLPGARLERLLRPPGDHLRRLLSRALPPSRSRSSASARTSSSGTTIRRSIVIGADFYDADERPTGARRQPAARHRPRRRRSIASSSTRTHGSATARGWSTRPACRKPTATATTSAAVWSSSLKMGSSNLGRSFSYQLSSISARLSAWALKGGRRESPDQERAHRRRALDDDERARLLRDRRARAGAGLELRAHRGQRQRARSAEPAGQRPPDVAADAAGARLAERRHRQVAGHPLSPAARSSRTRSATTASRGSAIIDAAPGSRQQRGRDAVQAQASLENVRRLRVESNSYPAEYEPVEGCGLCGLSV